MTSGIHKFNRFIKLSISPADDDFAVEDRVFSDLKIVFKVERYIGDTIHTMTVDIFNVNQGNKVSIPIQSGKTINLEAGYKELNGLLFKGLITNVSSFRQGNDIVTRLFCRDSKTKDEPRIVFSVSGSRNMTDLINDIASKAELDAVNINMQLNNVLKSAHFDGSFGSVMNALAKTGKFNWMILNQQLYIYDEKLGNTAIEVYTIDASSGLLENPVLTQLGLNIKMLMEPKVKPNDRFTVDREGIQFSQSGLEFVRVITRGLGDQKVQSVVHSGDTHGDQWYTEIIGEVIAA